MDIRELAHRPWLLLPGTLCTGAVFDGMLDEIGVPAANRQIVALDRPSVEAYAATFEQMPDGAIVCGFSLGAIVAAHFADRMNAAHLILFGVNPFADDPAKAKGRHDLAKDVKALGGAAALAMRTPEVFGVRPDQARALIYQMADSTADLIEAQTRLALTRPGAVPALAHARVPVLALTGTQDTSTPPDYASVAAQAAPDGEFVPLEGLGHFALLEDPQACAAALVNAVRLKNNAR